MENDPTRVHVRIDDALPLSADLVTAVTIACDRVEDAGGDAHLLLHVANTSTGARDWPGEVGVHVINKWEQALRRVERLGAATFAVVEGVCTGPALEVLLATDFRLMTPESRLSPAAGGRDWWPGMVLHRLANQIGLTRARQLVLFAGDVDPARAAELGLVDEVVNEPVERVAALSKLVRGREGSELAIRRRLLLEAVTTPFEESLGTHLAACDRELRRCAS
ncbi:hypothetical protein Lesp02_12620 [Lentzea sp. NBRC 105346]|uniref:enoyl-CoA-hydratase DpgB n=1 Tax=Lentzea sp. NBRC 105346 TaxID=3032205 RepID=UPI0024A12DAE|nr:enoyl-CoA-hydratase DpgB [Lentzea sp. NBRC 105346]GLZ29072.1 hypothetical protein Lesp02_12620 [Lentzea sp. NBRC 105346]